LQDEESVVWTQVCPQRMVLKMDRYLQQQGFRKVNEDNNIYIKVDRYSILIIEFYVYEIIFESDDDRMSQKVSIDMKNEFEMSLLGELNLFLGL
jgi:hypothetical protein